MAELKPCPFCGGKASVMRYHHINNASYCYCTSCKVRMPNMLTKEDAIAAWNRMAKDGN